jgi:hypothetical protein
MNESNKNIISKNLFMHVQEDVKVFYGHIYSVVLARWNIFYDICDENKTKKVSFDLIVELQSLHGPITVFL